MPTLTMSIVDTASRTVRGTLTGCTGTTVAQLIAVDHYDSAKLASASYQIATATPSAGTAVLTGTVSAQGCWYFQAFQNETGSEVGSLWLALDNLTRSDALTDALVSILLNNVKGINAAWQTFATNFSYTAGTIGTANVYVGDREKPIANGVTLCVDSGPETISYSDIALGDFEHSATRVIRGYVDLPPLNETTNRETEREYLRTTLVGAITEILLHSYHQTITDSLGYRWYTCGPVSVDVGEMVKADNKFYFAFEITWEASTQGSR